MIVRRLQLRAQHARQALGDDALERGGDQERLDAHLDQAGDRRGGVVGVQRGEHQVAGERGLDRDLRGLAVADLADHDHVGVGAHHRAQPGGERQADLGRDLHLGEAGHFILDGILDGDDVLLGRVEQLQRARTAWSTCPSRSGR